MSNRLPAIDLTIQWREPEVPSYWWLYSRRGGVLLPSRIFICDFEPGDEKNKLDRPFLAGQVGEQWENPKEIWMRVLRREIEPNHWSCALPMIPQEGLTPCQEHQYQMAILAWIKENDITHPLAKPYKPVNLAALPLPF